MNLLYKKQKILFMYCLYTVHRSHDTIYTFKNYFTTIFLISIKISYIETDLKDFQLMNPSELTSQ